MDVYLLCLFFLILINIGETQDMIHNHVNSVLFPYRDLSGIIGGRASLKPIPFMSPYPYLSYPDAILKSMVCYVLDFLIMLENL